MDDTFYPLTQAERHFQQVLLYAPGMLGNVAVNFFLDSFRQQGWMGATFQPWAPRKVNTKWGKKKRNAGRALLVKSGRGRRSIRITSANTFEVRIGTDVPYMRAHNEGVRLGIIQRVGQYQRRVKKGTATVSPHTRRINQRIPKRQFMGYSPVLDKQLQRRLMAELMKGLR